MKTKDKINIEELYYRVILEGYKEKIESLKLLDYIVKIYDRGEKTWNK